MSNGYRVPSAQANMIVEFYKDVISSSLDMPAVLITHIKLKQAKYRPPATVCKDDDGVYRRNVKMWIPNDATNLKQIVAVHA